MRGHQLVLTLVLIIDFEGLLNLNGVVLELMALEDQESVDGVLLAFVFLLKSADFLLKELNGALDLGFVGCYIGLLTFEEDLLLLFAYVLRVCL